LKAVVDENKFNLGTYRTLAQLELWKERASGKYARGHVYVLPKELDEKVNRRIE
jgi:adenosylhomocysteinase